eukprot:2038112-Amphidinium_carterae.2
MALSLGEHVGLLLPSIPTVVLGRVWALSFSFSSMNVFARWLLCKNCLMTSPAGDFASTTVGDAICDKFAVSTLCSVNADSTVASTDAHRWIQEADIMPIAGKYDHLCVRALLKFGASSKKTVSRRKPAFFDWGESAIADNFKAALPG